MTERNVFAKWDEAVDVEGLAKDVEEAAASGGGGNYKEVPHGTYEVEVNKMELVASKKGDPMVTMWFKIVTGEYKGSMIFLNQVITQGFQVHIVNEMLRSITAEAPNAPSVEFNSYKQYSDLLMDVFELIEGNFEFGLKYGKGKKDFNTYEITEVFPLEG